MASLNTITQTVLVAVRTARVDEDAPREPLDERVQFDVDALARVMRLSTQTADHYNAVIAACDVEFRHQLDERDALRALAALRLQERVTAPRLRVRQGPDGQIEVLGDS